MRVNFGEHSTCSHRQRLEQFLHLAMVGLEQGNGVSELVGWHVICPPCLPGTKHEQRAGSAGVCRSVAKWSVPLEQLVHGIVGGVLLWVWGQTREDAPRARAAGRRSHAK